MIKRIGAGTLLFIIGLAYFVASLEYQLGTLDNMGPGFYPRYLSAALMMLGVISIVRAVKQ